MFDRLTYAFTALLFLLVLGLAACSLTSYPTPTPASTPLSDKRHLLGGSTTRDLTPSPEMFAMPSLGLLDYQQLQFQVGNELFNTAWHEAGNDPTARDGLGPLYNATACSDCHRNDGRGFPPSRLGETGTGLLLRISLPGRDLHYQAVPEPTYGDQLQDDALDSITAEAQFTIEYTEKPGSFPDGETYSLRAPIYRITKLANGEITPTVLISPRLANQMIGLGLLEAVPAEVLLAASDPTDLNNDGISGRPNWVWDMYNQTTALGRFGWKANQPSLLQQVAAAFSADMGISNDLFPEQVCSAAQKACAAAASGGHPEISADDLLNVVLYSTTLAVPAQRDYTQPIVLQGEQLFSQIGCASCHTPSLKTGIHPTVPVLSNQIIHPYTDLLLHEMGSGLADDRPDFQANGAEWRTPPLWGIGALPIVNPQAFYLHDGRARSLLEAILWHGGEAAAVTEAFRQLSPTEREALLAFLRSL